MLLESKEIKALVHYIVNICSIGNLFLQAPWPLCSWAYSNTHGTFCTLSPKHCETCSFPKLWWPSPPLWPSQDCNVWSSRQHVYWGKEVRDVSWLHDFQITLFLFFVCFVFPFSWGKEKIDCSLFHYLCVRKSTALIWSRNEKIRNCSMEIMSVIEKN